MIMILPEFSGQFGMTVRYRCGQCNELSLVCIFFERVCREVLSADESRERVSWLSWADKLCILRKEIIVDNSKKDNNERVRDADRIIALALMEHLFNEGKISELVYRNIKNDTIKKVSVANRDLI